MLVRCCLKITKSMQGMQGNHRDIISLCRWGLAAVHVCHVSDGQTDGSKLEAFASDGNYSPWNFQFFNLNGYLVIDLFSSPEEIQEMRDRMAELLKGFDPSKSSDFSTKNQVLQEDVGGSTLESNPEPPTWEYIGSTIARLIIILH